MYALSGGRLAERGARVRKFSNVFRSFLISYIVILIIPSIAGYMSYRTSISVTQTASIENSVTQLQKTKELLERRMAEVEGFTRQLAINPDLNVLMNERSSGDQANVYGIWKMLRNVMTFGQTNDFLQQFYVYLSNYNVILTPGSAYFRPEHYYANFRYEDQTISEWKQTILGRTHRSEIMPLRPFLNKGVKTNVVTYMQSFPLDSFGSSAPAVAVVTIDEKTIANLLSGITDRYGGWTQITDAEGRVIASQGAGVPEPGALAEAGAPDAGHVSRFVGGDLVITTVSDTNGWVYRAGIPREELLKDANRIKRMTWSVTGIALGVGLLVGLALAYRNSAPIHKLVSVFGGDESAARNEYDFLHGNIAEMIRNGDRLQSELHRQLPLVRDAFLKRLLTGELQSREEIFAAASQANTGIYGHSGYVCLVRIEGYSDGKDSVDILNELSAARLILKQSLTEMAGYTLTTEWGSDRIVIVFAAREAESGSDVGKDEIASLLDQLSRKAFEEYRITFTASVGDRFAAETEVSASYEQAKLALEHADHSDRKGIVWYDEMRVDSSTYYYPLETELRLIGTIRAGEAEETRRILLAVLQMNTEQRELSVEMWHQLVVELKGTLLKLLNQKMFQESDRFEALKDRIIAIQAPDRKALQEDVVQIAEAMCDVVVGRKNESHMRIVEQIKAYVEERYSDAELTLYRIAEQVERPEKYISQLFKEVTGSNLSDYLEGVRLDHAVKLLTEQKYTVDEISSRVGYNSSHSFRRAFKRVKGVSPSSYRQSAEE